MTQKRVVVYGAGLDPAGKHHQKVVRALRKRFDLVVVFPCGPNRTDKPRLDDTELVHRATMVDITFQGMPGVMVDLSDIDQGAFTRHIDLEKKFSHLGEVWLAVGSDWIVPNAAGLSRIQAEWFQGEELWNQSRFAIIERSDYPLGEATLPPQSQVITIQAPGSSSMIRNKVFNGESIDGLVVEPVRAYIERYRLYRGAPRTHATFSLDQPRIMTVIDEANSKALELRERFDLPHPEWRLAKPDLIIVVGGDGTMLQAVRKHWRKRVPFFGINAGHSGFLMNEPDDRMKALRSGAEIFSYHMPLLDVSTIDLKNRPKQSLAFNDAWIERQEGQTAWVEVKINGEIRVPSLKGDSVLICTAAGSTAYARAMGAIPLPIGTPNLTLTGSNIIDPDGWRPMNLEFNSVAEFTALNTGKRPVRGFIDGVRQGPLRSMKIRVSNVASCELAFLDEYNLTKKMMGLQLKTR
jgi:NAD+ kinase